MVTPTNLGFPRIGGNRELKKLVENHWSSKLDTKSLLLGVKNLRAEHWTLQSKAGIANGHIPSNDFSLYDQVLDHLILFDVVPQRYRGLEYPLETTFAMGRGLQKPEIGVDVPAMEMKKWFDTNYHFIVPEFHADQSFTLRGRKPIDEFLEAKALGITTRPVLLGPISLLRLGKPTKGLVFDPITLLDHLIPAYESLLHQLSAADPPRYLLCRLGDNITLIDALPIQALHVDLIRAPEELDALIALAHRNTLTLSLGVINGRNIWKSDLSIAISKIQRAVTVLGTNKVWVAPSCSLLHSPHSLDAETAMSKDILDWLSFAVEKLHEIVLVSKAVNEGQENPIIAKALADNLASLKARRESPLINDPTVRAEMKAVTEDMFRRRSAFSQRYASNKPNSTFPFSQPPPSGRSPDQRKQYDDFIQQETIRCIRFQEQVGLDVLVHGEFERNDMVEYFGENLDGYVFSKNGWVQSYGSRCVKPPIIYGDVARPRPMTVSWSHFAQSQTTKPMKGMLTGPVTMLQWSFVRDDQERRETAFQLALAIRKEVGDLEKAGIPVIQIDEPAIREGLPLRRTDWEEYLKWAARAFLLSSTGVRDDTQIHTHMCYSDFNDILPTIQSLDADVITIENSKSDLKLLTAFDRQNYTNAIGPGLYDIHSPRIPSTEEMQERLQAMLKYLKKELVWVNPDCGLKTRGGRRRRLR
ncbi:cobalamin-independent synthase [Chytridium lagenaria]|nr:cobalamin-independent synthase [Chytridium lagenaria]